MPKRHRAGTIKFEQSLDDLCLPFLFDLPSDRLIVVDVSCIEQLDFFQKVLTDADVVGIDTETEPRVRPSMPLQKTSLLQLSIRTKLGEEYVFIVDLISLFSDNEIVNRVDSMLGECLRNQSVTKVAHALRGDALEICDSYPSTSAFLSIRNVLEVSTLHRVINPHVDREVSLKYMTKHYLHGNLVKSHQCSSWGSRPLSEGQIHYAACDALVLLRLYDALCCEIDELFGGSEDVADVYVDMDVLVGMSPSPSLSSSSISPRYFRQTPSAERKKKAVGESCRTLQLL